MCPRRAPAARLRSIRRAPLCRALIADAAAALISAAPAVVGPAQALRRAAQTVEGPAQAASQTEPALVTGFTDSAYAEPGPVREAWLQRTVSVGAQIVLLQAAWSQLSPSAPLEPGNPADPAYRWRSLDEQVRAAAARGLRVAIAVSSAPHWAEGPGRPAGVATGVWRPDAAAFAAFARAIAQRYDGAFADPQRPGESLPPVRVWQAWTEPNLSTHLAPQWARHGRRYAPAAPGIYRQLLNVFYREAKAVNGANFVLTAGTAPFGDPPGGQRMAPALFVRTLLCVSASSSAGASLRLDPCPEPAHFDALAHDPYSIGGPYQHALNPDDVSVPDLGRLTQPLRLAERTGRALPRAHKQLWVTEFSWDSYPPKPGGVPLQEHARWLEEAFYELWREGASAAIWYQVRDALPIPNYASSYQSGVYFHDGRPKPAAVAFQFPFVLQRGAGSTVYLWTRSPAQGALTVERMAPHGGWRVVLIEPARPGQILYRRLRIRSATIMRARVGTDVSLPFRAP